MKTKLLRDGVVIAEFDGPSQANDAFRTLHKKCSASCYWAIRYEGYNIISYDESGNETYNAKIEYIKSIN